MSKLPSVCKIIEASGAPLNSAFSSALRNKSISTTIIIPTLFGFLLSTNEYTISNMLNIESKKKQISRSTLQTRLNYVEPFVFWHIFIFGFSKRWKMSRAYFGFIWMVSFAWMQWNPLKSMTQTRWMPIEKFQMHDMNWWTVLVCVDERSWFVSIICLVAELRTVWANTINNVYLSMLCVVNAHAFH